VESNPEHYWVVFENERVRVLGYLARLVQFVGGTFWRRARFCRSR
jgi:hypothetical protein